MTSSVDTKRSFKIVATAVNLLVNNALLLTLSHYNTHLFSSCSVNYVEAVKLTDNSLRLK